MLIFTLSIPTVLDRYGTGTVPFHLSTSVNVSLIPYCSVPFRNPVFLWGSFWNKLFRYGLVRSVCNVDRWIGTVPLQVWTHAVPYRSNLYRNSLYRCGTTPDMDRVIELRQEFLRNGPLISESWGRPTVLFIYGISLYVTTIALKYSVRLLSERWN